MHFTSVGTDDGELVDLRPIERQGGLVVLQQDERCPRRLERERLRVGRVRDTLGFVRIRIRMLEEAGEELEPQHVPGRGIHEPFVETARLHFIHQRQIRFAIRQFEIDARRDRQTCRLVHRAGDLVAIEKLLDRVVVGDDKALKAPLLPEDALQQELAGRRGDTVDLVVRRHHRHHVAFLDRSLEGPQQLFAKLALGNLRRRGVDAALVRAVRGEVLRGGEDVPWRQRRARPLVTADRRKADLGDEVWVLAVGFFGASPSRVAREVDDRGEDLLRAARARLAGGDRHDAFDERGIPAARECDRDGEIRAFRRRQAVKRLLVEHRGHCQPRVLHHPVLDRVDELCRLARIASLVAAFHAVAHARDLPDAVLKNRRRLGRIEVAGGIHQRALLLPDRQRLRDLLLERHPREQILHAAINRKRSVLVWWGGLCGKSERRSCRQRENDELYAHAAQISSFRLPVARYQLPVSRFRLPGSGFRLPAPVGSRLDERHTGFGSCQARHVAG